MWPHWCLLSEKLWWMRYEIMILERKQKSDTGSEGPVEAAISPLCLLQYRASAALIFKFYFMDVSALETLPFA